MSEECARVFIGEETYCAGVFKKENKQLFKREWVIPYLWCRWVPVASNINGQLELYEERQPYNLSEGIAKEPVKIHWIDLPTLKAYSGKGNEVMARQLNSLKAERDSLYYLSQELFAHCKLIGQEDVVMEKFKRQHKFFTGLRPEWNPMMGAQGGKK